MTRIERDSTMRRRRVDLPDRVHGDQVRDRRGGDPGHWDPGPGHPFQVPASAPQPGTADLLDTLDARNTQAVSAVDPAHGGVTALWTQHAVFGGAGSQVRWYEINPATHARIGAELTRDGPTCPSSPPT